MTELTRRQRSTLWALENGWVAELRVPRNPRHQSRLYFMRSPGAIEADGPVVTGHLLDSLIRAGLAVALDFHHARASIVLGADFYRQHADAFAVLTGTTTPPPTNHPRPRFRDRPPT